MNNEEIKKDMHVYLETAKQVMKAFLNGHRLANTDYDSQDCWLYLSEWGDICEEDGAGAKADRVPITMRNDQKWWIYDRT